MKYRIIKYGLLGILAILTLYQNFPIGDYCSGLGQALAMLFLGGLFLLALIIFLAIDLFRKFKRKKTFDFIPLVMLTLFLAGNYALLTTENNKFWTNEELVGIVDVGDLQAAQLVLYTNGTFGARTSYVDWSCTYTGRYSIEGHVLRLKRDDLAQQTNQVFTTAYNILTTDSLLIPLGNGFEKIKIKKLGQQK